MAEIIMKRENRLMKSLLGAAIAAGVLLCVTTPAAAGDDARPNRFITVGTKGGPVLDPARGQPANALLVGDDAWLIDAGDGAASRLAAAGVSLRDLDGVFISHIHFDHTAGLAAVIGLRYQTNAPGALTIYGPPGTREMVDGLLAFMAPMARSGYGLDGATYIDPAETVDVIEIRDGARIALDGVTVTAAENTHYSFAKGSALDEQFDSLSLRFDLADRSIVYSGDTGPSAALEKLAKGADILFVEMIDPQKTIDVLRKTSPDLPPAVFEDMIQHLSAHHLTTREIGKMAARAKVKKVVVTHVVVGEGDPPVAPYIDEIRDLFDGDVAVAEDLDQF